MAFNQLLISNLDTPLTEGAELAFFPPVTGG
jgi:molybdopterin converting factor small subunit